MKQLFLIMIATLFSTSLALAQRNVTGTVKDEGGETLVGATVTVKNSNPLVGVSTDADGKFNIKVPSGYEVLTISYIGYESQEVTLGASNVVDVTMMEGNVLGDVVVAALGVSREKKSLGYSSQQVGGENLDKFRDANIVNSLSGKVAGVQVTGGNGNMGGSSRIVIRGVRSLTANNQPLFVVDGIPMDNSNFTSTNQARGGGGYDYGNAIQDINPDDIESVNVLKGQAAAALYGSRGANGVIIITTKKGSKTKKGLGVSINSGMTFEKVAVLPKYQNRYGGGTFGDDPSGFYVEHLSPTDSVLVPDYATDESWGPELLGQQVRHWNSWDEWDTEHYGKTAAWDPEPNNIKDFYETGLTTNNSIAVDGANDWGSFRLSYTNFHQKGTLPNSKLNRNTVSLNGELKLSKKVRTFAGINFVQGTGLGRSGTGYDNDGRNVPQMFNQWFHRDLNMNELRDYLNPDGTQRSWNRTSATDGSPYYWDNPFWTRYKNYQNDKRTRFYGNVGATVDIVEGLSITGRVLNDFYTERREERVAVGSVATSKYSEQVIDVNEMNTDLTLNYTKRFNDLSLTAMVGGNRMTRVRNSNFGTTVGGLNIPDFYNLDNSVGNVDVTDETFEKKINSLFGNISLGYKGYVYLDATLRNDWSSTLPQENNSYLYPSVSGSFVFSELMKENNILSFGKVRLGWAQVGNDASEYSTKNVYTPVSSFGNTPSFSVPNTLNNPNLKPELTSSYEAGLELNFLSNRFNVDFSYYNTRSKNQIIPISVSPATGFPSQYINAGLITNSGIELALNMSPVKTKDFEWTIGFNIAKNKNMVKDLNENDSTLTNITLATAPFAVTLNAYEGQPYGTIFGRDFLYDANGNRLINPANGNYFRTSSVAPIGNITPDFVGGVSTSLSYKGIRFYTLFDFRKGGDIFSLTNVWGKYSGLLEETAVGDIRENGVVNTNGVLATVDAGGLPVLVSAGNPNVIGDEVYQSSGTANTTAVEAESNFYLNGGYRIGRADVYDGSFVKLREMSLGYTFPKGLIKGVSDVTISIIGRNLAILKKNTPHIDPETAISSGNVQGIEGGQVPSSRSIGFNLNFKF